jgi:hypothetical protein
MEIFQKIFFHSHLDEGERLFFVVHKHYIEVAHAIGVFLLLGVVFPFFLWFFFNIPFPFLFLLFLGMSIWLLYHLVDWYFDVWILTNYSILQVDWQGFFNRTSSRIDYGDIKEVTYSINGFVPTMLDFGQITILTVSGGSFTLPNVAFPKKIEMVIRDYRSKYARSQRFSDTENLDQMISALVQKHIADNGVPPPQKYTCFDK